MTESCVCGCPREDHVTGLCLHTLDCLCRGYVARAAQPIPLGAEVEMQCPTLPLHGRRAVVVAYVETKGAAQAVLLRLVPDEEISTG